MRSRSSGGSRNRAPLRTGLERFYRERGDLCLCLSGGGFRAAAFHLGVVRWLYERRLLPHLGEIRSVSGGSVTAAWMYMNRDLLFGDERPTGDEFEAEFATPLREFLATDIRTMPIVRTLGRNVAWKRKRCHLVEQEINSLLQTRPPGNERTPGPEFRLISFDIHFRELVELTPKAPQLARQVVASAAYPPLIGPVELDGRHLVDGGLASNLGVTGDTLNMWRCVLLSDAGRASPGWTRSRAVPMTLRLMPLLRDGANRAFRSQIAAANSETTIVAVVPLAAKEWYPSERELVGLKPAGFLARLRTDLAGFSPARIDELEERGHQVASMVCGEAIETWSERAGFDALKPGRPGLSRLLEEWGS